MRWSNLPVPEAHSVAIVVGLGLRWLTRPSPRRRPMFASVVGWGLLGAGLALAGRATADMGEIDSAEPTRLITTGAFAHSRNPMYLAWTLIQAGIGVLVNARWVLALIPAVLAYTDRVVIPQEEQQLAAAFGDAYRRYRTRVPRYW